MSVNSEPPGVPQRAVPDAAADAGERLRAPGGLGKLRDALGNLNPFRKSQARTEPLVAIPVPPAEAPAQAVPAPQPEAATDLGPPPPFPGRQDSPAEPQPGATDQSEPVIPTRIPAAEPIQTGVTDADPARVTDHREGGTEAVGPSNLTPEQQNAISEAWEAYIRAQAASSPAQPSAGAADESASSEPETESSEVVEQNLTEKMRRALIPDGEKVGPLTQDQIRDRLSSVSGIEGDLASPEGVADVLSDLIIRGEIVPDGVMLAVVGAEITDGVLDNLSQAVPRGADLEQAALQALDRQYVDIVTDMDAYEAPEQLLEDLLPVWTVDMGGPSESDRLTPEELEQAVRDKVEALRGTDKVPLVFSGVRESDVAQITNTVANTEGVKTSPEQLLTRRDSDSLIVLLPERMQTEQRQEGASIAGADSEPAQSSVTADELLTGERNLDSLAADSEAGLAGVSRADQPVEEREDSSEPQADSLLEDQQRQQDAARETETRDEAERPEIPDIAEPESLRSRRILNTIIHNLTSYRYGDKEYDSNDALRRLQSTARDLRGGEDVFGGSFPFRDQDTAVRTLALMLNGGQIPPNGRLLEALGPDIRNALLREGTLSRELRTQADQNFKDWELVNVRTIAVPESAQERQALIARIINGFRSGGQAQVSMRLEGSEEDIEELKQAISRSVEGSNLEYKSGWDSNSFELKDEPLETADKLLRVTDTLNSERVSQVKRYLITGEILDAAGELSSRNLPGDYKNYLQAVVAKALMGSTIVTRAALGETIADLMELRNDEQSYDAIIQLVNVAKLLGLEKNGIIPGWSEGRLDQILVYAEDAQKKYEEEYEARWGPRRNT